MFRRLTAVASTVLALAACSATPSTEPTQSMQPTQDSQPTQVSQPVLVTLSGAVQKGPFVVGSSVTVTPAASTTSAPATASKAALAVPTADVASGQLFKTETSSDRGEFTVALAYQGPALIEATGYYYNEALGQLSGAPLTLRALTSVGDSDSTTYVNLITHLTRQRVQALVAGGATFADASAQAESDLQAELGFGDAPSTAATQLSLEGGDNDDSAYLFAVSTVFAQAAYLDVRASCNCADAAIPGMVDASVQELINTTSAAFATEGKLPSATKDKLVGARATIDNSKVEAALAARLAKVGSTATVPDLDRVIPWSVPQSVTDCAANMPQNVSEGCRMSLCGISARPLSAEDAQGDHNWQTIWSSCGTECWAVMQCFAQNCSRDIGRGRRSISTSCASCQDGAFGTGQLTVGASELAQVAIDTAASGQCDADLGLAK